MRVLRILWWTSLLFGLSSCASTQDGAKTARSATSGASSSVEASSSSSLGKSVSRPSYNVDAIESVDASMRGIESALQQADEGNLSGAISSLTEVSKKYPKSFIAHYDLGLLYERQLDTTRARAAYQAALEAEPNFSQALIQIVRMDIRAGNPEAGIRTAESYIAKTPAAFDHSYAKLEGMIAARQYDASIALCRSLLKKDEANAKLRYYLALVEFERGRYRLSDFIVGESLDIDPNDAEALFLRARIHEALSSEDVALIPGIASTLDRVLELNPDYIEALWMRANIYYEASHYEKAESMYRHILELNPKIVGVMVNLANTLKTVDRGPEAEKLLLEARGLDPNNGLVDFAMGTLYLNFELIKLPMKDMDRLKLARTQFESASQHWTDPEDIALAKGYIRTTDDAIETLQAALDAEALFGSFSESGEEEAGAGESGETLRVD